MEGLAKPPIVVICGPTASGKTALALTVSRHFGGEMIGADSMQIYKGLPVGTAAVTPQEAGGVPQHMVGFLPPQCGYSVAQYVQDAGKAIREITARGRLPVVCGGTGLYIKSLVEGTLFARQQTDEQLRQNLQQELHQKGTAHMLQLLTEADPEYAGRLAPGDEKRIVRGLEQYKITGLTYAQRAAASKPPQKPYNALCIGLTFANRQTLYQRIDARVLQMLQNGLLEEARWVYQNRQTFTTAAQAIGYKEIFAGFEGEKNLEECAADLQQATRRYAKRQLTWFRHMQEVQWLYAEEEPEKQAEERIRSFLK